MMSKSLMRNRRNINRSTVNSKRQIIIILFFFYFLEIIEQIDLTKLDLNLEDLSDDGGHIPSGNLTVLNIRQNNYRFCPMCSKDKIPANELPEHVKKCLATSSKIYNSFISMKG